MLPNNCVKRLELLLKEALIWSDRFIEGLNMEMDGLLSQYRGVRLLDTNYIASVYGRRFIQEDAYWLVHSPFVTLTIIACRE